LEDLIETDSIESYRLLAGRLSSNLDGWFLATRHYAALPAVVVFREPSARPDKE